MEYKNILKETILNEYPVYFQASIIKSMETDGVIYNDRRKNNNSNLIDLTLITKEKYKLEYLFDNLDDTIKYCENFEYERAYRYSAIFNISNLDVNKIEELCNENTVLAHNSTSFTNDYTSPFAMKPTYKIDPEDNNIIYLKFSYELKSRDEENIIIKYPALCVIYRDLNVLEIRLDTVAYKYRTKEIFYKEKISLILGWIKAYLGCDIENINFEAITKLIKSEKSDEVTVVALKMKRDGMLALLDSASNEELTIPILGELKELVNDNNLLLDSNDQTKEIKSILNNFIEEIEETSYIPSAKILWHEKKIKLLAIHGYKDGEYSLFKYSDELRDKESMKYVTRYFIQCEGELRESLNIE